jgi:hypothetical protein
MEIRAALLCDSATVREGLLHVLGGGINRIWRPTLPAPLSVALACLVAIDPTEAEQLHEVHMTVSSPNMQLGDAMGALQASVPPKIEPGETMLLPIVLPLHNIGTVEYGRHVVRLSFDAGLVSDELQFWVLHPDEMKLPSPNVP